MRRRVKDLKKNLETCMGALRALGSSTNLLRAAKKLEEGLTVILNQMRYITARIWSKFSTSNERPHSTLPEELQNGTLTASWMLAKSFQTLSDSLREFLDGLHVIPEFESEKLTNSLKAFHHWLRYRANTVNAYAGT